MSLVIDANDGGATKLVASNINSGLYINFNQLDYILIAPQGFRRENSTKTDGLTFTGDSLNVVKDVNGTKINFWSGIIYEDLNYPSLGTFAIANSSNGNYTHNYNNIKIGSTTPMNGGEIIGRQIICRPRYVARGSVTGTIKVGLLHTDGSITYTNHSITIDQANGWLYVSEGDGIVASQGDYVFADISISMRNSSWSSSSGWSAYTWIEFGAGFNDGDGNPGTNARPIQISIE